MELKYSHLVLLVLSTLFALSIGEEMRLTNCDEEDVMEAKTAFKNCIDSAKNSILENLESYEELQPLCEKLSSLLDSCEEERTALAECTNEVKVDNVIDAHLTSIRDTIDSLKPDLNVESCSVFVEEDGKEEETVDQYEDENEEDGEAEVEGETEVTYDHASPLFLSLPLLVLTPFFLLFA